VPSCPPSALNYFPTIKTGQTLEYGSFSDGFYQFGALVDFFTLAQNNPFSNTDRFTDLVGTQVYLEDIILDWSTYNPLNGNIIMMYVGDKTLRLWEDNKVFINGATVNGWSDWYMPNWNQVNNILYHGVTNITNYPPFNMPSIASSTTRTQNTLFYICSLSGVIGSLNKTNQSTATVYFRNGNISELI
jgi:hypothetical protein